MHTAAPRVIGRYALYEAIASGGMATVHIGRLLGSAGFSRTVAIKRMHPALAQDPDFVSMFLDEARLVARVSHPNVVPTLDVVATDGELFIVMEYVRGESLVRLLRAARNRGAFVPPPIVAAIMAGVLHGLHAAHEAKSEQGEPLGIVHRDVSPQNILVGVDGAPRVLDFGVAKAIGRLQTTHEGELKGKLAYMAPEQVSGQTTRQTDVYAAAVVLWETLAGHRLFDAENEAAILARVLAGCATPPSSRAAAVPPELDEVALRGLAIDPAKRFATAREMALALERAVVLANASRVGEWVLRTAEDALAARDALVAAIESDSGLTAPPAADGAGTAGGTRVEGRRTPSARSTAWRWGAAGLAAATTLGAYGALRPDKTAAPAPSTSAIAPIPRPTTLADLPPPATGSAEAAAEYAAGIQALRDNSWGSAERHFTTALERDPALAAAHLRLSMIARFNDAVEKRAEFAKAVALRARLTDRDRTLLEALEPILQRVHEEPVEARARVERAVAIYPLDAELRDWLAILREGDPAGALDASDRAIELDAKDGEAWQIKGESLAFLGRMHEAREALERCKEIAVDSADCMSDVARIDALEGKCDLFEADVRRWFDRDPGVTLWLAVAMLSRGATLDAAQEVSQQGLSVYSTRDMRETMSERRRGLFASFAGDFALAENLDRHALEAMSTLAETRTDGRLQLNAALDMLEPLRETGKNEEAGKFAAGFLARSATWTVGRDEIDALYLLSKTSGKGEKGDEFERHRATWVNEQLAQGAYPGLVWVHAYAATALTEQEARAALDVLPQFGPIASFVTDWLRPIEPDAYAGRTYLLAGRAAEAISYLQRTVRNCLGPMQPAIYTRAALHLGEALEATGDAAGACAAYGVVLDRWGKARPRSVTANEAKQRAAALWCPPRSPVTGTGDGGAAASQSRASVFGR